MWTTVEPEDGQIDDKGKLLITDVREGEIYVYFRMYSKYSGENAYFVTLFCY